MIHNEYSAVNIENLPKPMFFLLSFRGVSYGYIFINTHIPLFNCSSALNQGYTISYPTVSFSELLSHTLFQGP